MGQERNFCERNMSMEEKITKNNTISYKWIRFPSSNVRNLTNIVWFLGLVVIGFICLSISSFRSRLNPNIFVNWTRGKNFTFHPSGIFYDLPTSQKNYSLINVLIMRDGTITLSQPQYCFPPKNDTIWNITKTIQFCTRFIVM